MSERNFFQNLMHNLGGDPGTGEVVPKPDTSKGADSKDPAKDSSNPKDSPKDTPKDAPKDAPKDTPKDAATGAKDPKPAKDNPKDSKAKNPKPADDDKLDLDLLRSLLDAADDSDDDADTGATDDATGEAKPDETMSTKIGNVGATINPLKPILKQEGKRNMKMRDRDFYDRIGDLAYYHDRGDEGDYSELDTYMKEYKTEALSETDLIKEIDACLEADFARFSAVLLDRIANAESNRPDPVKRLFINKIDKKDATEYETFEKAAESVKDNPYVTDPKAVFEQVWRQVNPDGTLGARVSEQEIRKYADTLNAKNRGAFLTRMGLAEQKPQNQQKKPNNQGDGKKGDKPGKPNKPSDNGSGASTSGAGN